MGYISTEFTVEPKLRPCTVRGKNYGEPSVRAWFHQWFEKDELRLHFKEMTIRADSREKILKDITGGGVIPTVVDPIVIKKLCALIEYENGDVAFVDPLRISFIDTKRVEDEYYIPSKYKPKECEIRGE